MIIELQYCCGNSTTYTCENIAMRYTTDPKVAACDDCADHNHPDIQDLSYAPALRAALCQENEACATAAEDCSGGDAKTPARFVIADKIRARRRTFRGGRA